MASPELNRSLSHHVPSSEVVPDIAKLRQAAIAFGTTLEELCLPGRELSFAKTKLEECLMWAVKGMVLDDSLPHRRINEHK